MEHINYDMSGGRCAGVTRVLHVLKLRAFRLSRQIFVKWQCSALLHRVAKWCFFPTFLRNLLPPCVWWMNLVQVNA